MGGQGSPNLHRYPRVAAHHRASVCCGWRCAPRPFALITFVLIVFTLLIAPRACDAQQPATQSDLSLRFAWGGGVPQKWKGSISIENGSLVESRPLAITSDAPSTVVARKENQLAIDHRISTSYGGADVSIAGDRDTSIKFSIKTDAGKEFQRTWTIDELSAGVNASIDGQNRLAISRTPEDEVAVEINRPHLVFDPGETWRFEFGLRLSELEKESAQARFYWLSTDGSKQGPAISDATTTLSTDRDGNSALKPIELSVPQREGAHKLLIEFEAQPEKTNFGQFRRPTKITRQVEIVVVSPHKPPRNSKPWKPFKTWTAQQLQGGFANTWPQLSRSGEPTRKGKLSLVSIDAESKSAIQLESTASISVPVSHPDGAAAKGPMRVSIRYRSIPGTKLGVNYLSMKQQVLHGMDSGVAVPQSAAGIDSEEQWLEHSFHIWPEPTGGTIRIVNDAMQPALIGEIKLESGPARLSTNFAARENAPAARRQRMAFLESPDFAGLFQAQRIADPQTGQALDNWDTFFDSANRLTQHLKANSYDGAFVTIASDGSAIFPSAGLASGPRYDSGIFASTGCDLVQKDVVELMLRLFDREGLSFIPVLTLNSTIETLESLRQADRMSFDLVAADGGRTDFNRQLLPVYNPLDRTLQNLCTQGVRRVADRYRAHPSFSGLALACRPNCCTLLPSAQHGRDNITLKRFSDAQESAAADTADAADAWLTWRSQQMAAWYDTLQQQTGNDLYLLPLDIDQRPEFIRSMNPSLQHGGDYELAMKEVGLDLSGRENQRVKVLASIQVAPGFSLAQKRVDLNTRQSLAAEQFIAQRSAGALYSHRGSWRSMDANSESAARLRLYTPAGNFSRRRYIESIRKHDCRLFIESGASLPRVADESFEGMLNVIRALPAQRFQDVGDPKKGPVCMRQLSVDGMHYLYAINDSPWPIRVTAALKQKQLPQVLQASSGSNGGASPLKTPAGQEVLLKRGVGGTDLEIFLEPWSIYAAVAETNSSYNPYAIDNFQIELPEGSDSQLRKKLHQLKSKLAKAKLATPLPALFNGSFESFADPDKSGWEFGNHQQAKFDLDLREFHHGKVALSMHSSGEPVWIRSNRMPLPKTGRLSVSAWLKTSDLADLPPRIAVQGISDNADFYRYRSLVNEADGQASLDATWRQFVVHFDDLPDDLTDMRIGFDLPGPGQISIDQVEIFDRWFDENDSVAMTQLLASAGSRLQDEAAVDSSRRVLENYWVQFLDRNIGRKDEAPPEVPDRQTRGGLEFVLPEMRSFEFPQMSPATSQRLPIFQRRQK